MKVFVLSVAAILSSAFFQLSNISASNINDSNRTINVTDLFFGGISSYSNLSNISLYEMRKLTARSVLLQTDLSGHNYNSYFSPEDGSAYFGFSIGKSLNKSDVITYRLNFAISYSNTNTLYAGLYRTDSIPFDTLTSSQTGNVYYVKKLTNDSYNIYYESGKFTIDVNGIVSTNPLKRFSFYAGFGLSYGIGLTASTEITHNNYSFYSPSLNYGNPDFNDNFVSESFKNQSGFSFSLYVPIGVQFRFGKQSKFWKRLYMYYEFDAGMSSEYIPELGSYTGFYPGSRFGYKYHIGRLD